MFEPRVIISEHHSRQASQVGTAAACQPRVHHCVQWRRRSLAVSRIAQICLEAEVVQLPRE